MVDQDVLDSKVPTHPVFQKYTPFYLHQLSGYSIRYLKDVGAGRRELSPSMKRVLTAVLDEPESDLYTP